MDGLEAASRRILEELAAALIPLVTTFGLDKYVFEALRIDASGFVLKDEAPEQLLAVVRMVAGGEALLSSSITPYRWNEIATPLTLGWRAIGKLVADHWALRRSSRPCVAAMCDTLTT